MKKNYFLLALAFFLFAIVSCKKEANSYHPLTLEEYYPLQTGKYITYKLDSLVYYSFGTKDSTASYQAKYVVDSLTTDNLGRPAYRIFRFLRRAEPDAWVPSGTFMALNTQGSIEYIENNMRFLKLKFPLEAGFTWKGNTYIDTYSLNSDVKYLDDWDYIYENVGQPATIGTFKLDQTITVNERDEISGDPSDPTGYSEVNFSKEQYGFGIGLVYRKFFHSEFQPGDPGFIADGSYGITMTMIDHN